MQERYEKDPARGLFGTAVSLGLNMTAGVFLFAALGHYVDQKRGGGRMFTLAGIFAGLLYGAYEVWKVVRRISRKGD